MTPNELLETTKTRFSVLLIDDSEQLTTYLKSAIRAYQNKAGVRQTAIFTEEGTHPLPGDFLAISAIKDVDKDAVFTSPVMKDGIKHISFDEDEYFPITVSYFIDLTKLDLVSDQLPGECIELVSKHLQIQIERENDKRKKQIEAMANADVSDFSTPSDKDAELKSIEEQMATEMSFVELLTLQG